MSEINGAAQTLLIADDERDIVDMLKRFFERKGYRVLVAYGGQEALKLAQQFDDSPNFDARSYRFMDDARNPTLHEIMGRTAVESMGYIARLLDDGQMTALWERITENEHAKN